MNGTEWVYRLIDNITSPLGAIQKSLAVTDTAAAKAEAAIAGIGDFGMSDFGFVPELGNQVTDVAQKTSVLPSAFKAAAVAATAFFAATSVGDIAANIFNVGSNMEQTRIAYKVLLQDADLAKQKLGELQKFADVSPFNTGEVLDAGQALLGFGVKSQNLLPIMNMLGDASSGNANKFKSLVDNYGKLVSAQRANTMDLNQFALQGIPIWDALSKKLGKSSLETKEYVEKNGLAAETVTELLRGMTEKGGQFFGMMDEQGKSTAGMWSTFESGIERVSVKIFDKMRPTIIAMIEWGTNVFPVFENALASAYHWAVDFASAIGNIITWIGDNQDIFVALGISLVGVGTAWLFANAQMLISNALMTAGGILVTALEAVQKSITVATNGWAAAQRMLNYAFIQNPLVGWITVAFAVGAVLYLLWERCEWLRGVVFGVWESLQALGKGMIEIAQSYIMGFIHYWQAVGEIIMGVFTLDMSLIKKGMGDAVNAMKEAVPIDKVMKLGEDVGKAYEKGRANSIKNFRDEKAQKAAEKESTSVNVADTTGKTEEQPKSVVTPQNASGSSSSEKAGSGKIINVRIENLAKDVKIYGADVKQGVVNFRKLLSEELTAAVRDFELGISNGGN